MKRDFPIRPLEEGDFQRGFLEALGNLRFPDISPKEAQVVFLKHINQHPDIYKVFVAESEGQIVGTTTLFIEQKFIHRGGRVGHVEDVAVCKEHERRGIGSALIKHALSEAIRCGCYKVILDCGEHNMSFYKRLGFRHAESCMRHDLGR